MRVCCGPFPARVPWQQPHNPTQQLVAVLLGGGCHGAVPARMFCVERAWHSRKQSPLGVVPARCEIQETTKPPAVSIINWLFGLVA